MSTRRRILYFFQHKETKNWIASVNKDGTYEFSPRMQDAMLFFPMQANASSKEYHREYVEVRVLTVPRPRVTKPKKPKAKAVKKKASEANDVVNPELAVKAKA